ERALRRQQPDLWQSCSGGDGSHPRTCQPARGGRRGSNEIKVAGEGPGEAPGLEEEGTPLCPLYPGAPEFINSAVSSQTRPLRCSPRGAPAPAPGRVGGPQTTILKRPRACPLWLLQPRSSFLPLLERKPQNRAALGPSTMESRDADQPGPRGGGERP
ncbi:hypothetical protein EI555_001371, partial [Monodon monoceros]